MLKEGGGVIINSLSKASKIYSRLSWRSFLCFARGELRRPVVFEQDMIPMFDRREIIESLMLAQPTRGVDVDDVDVFPAIRTANQRPQHSLYAVRAVT